MSCSFLKMFYPEASRKEILELIEDNYKNGGLDFWVKKYLTDDAVGRGSYKKFYQPSTVNLSSIVNDYMDSVTVLRTLTGNKTPFTEEETAKLNKFYEINGWDDLFKGFMRNRKLYGDSYTSVSLYKSKDYGTIPILKTLEAKHIEIATGSSMEDRYQTTPEDIDREVSCPDIDNREYILSFEREYNIRTDDTRTTTEKVSKEIMLVFKKGKVLPFINEVLVPEDTIDYVNTGLEDRIPIIHLQFMKEDSEPYSKIPSLEFIDDCIRLDRIETNISETNNQSGSPQIIAIDGNFDDRSEFGAKAIAYLDTSASAIRAGKQATIKQLEITNGLESLNSEQDKTIDNLYDKANLIPPSIHKLLAKSNSGKVARFYTQDLLNEVKKGYEEVARKTAFIWNILFPDRKDEKITLLVPEDIASTMYDKASYIAANLVSLREFKRQQGATPEEIDTFIEEIKEQVSIFNGTSMEETTSHSQIDGVSTADISEKQTVRDNDPDNVTADIEGIDNRLKNTVKN